METAELEFSPTRGYSEFLGNQNKSEGNGKERSYIFYNCTINIRAFNIPHRFVNDEKDEKQRWISISRVCKSFDKNSFASKNEGRRVT